MESLSDLVADVEAAVAALAAAVAAPGFDTAVDDTVLHESVIALERAKSALAVGSAQVLSRWDTRRVWMPGGHRPKPLAHHAGDGSCPGIPRRLSHSSPGFRIPGHPSPAGGTAETERTLSPAK